MPPELPRPARSIPIAHRYWTGPARAAGRDALCCRRRAWWMRRGSPTRVARAGRRVHARDHALDRGDGPADRGPADRAVRRRLRRVSPRRAARLARPREARRGSRARLCRHAGSLGHARGRSRGRGSQDRHGPAVGAVATRRLRAARADDTPVTRRRRLVVQLLPTGRYSVREYPLVNFGRDERVFLAALAVAQWKRAA